jgi:16S rRNA (guanine527-N7)-methyltransferase
LQTVLASSRVVDIGSGAGFPILVLAIMFPHLSMVAVEATQKKARFITETASSLGLSQVTVYADRSETLAHRVDCREQFDLALARAVAPLQVLAELCLPWVKPGGQFLAMKTQHAAASEIIEAKHAIRLLGGGEPMVHEVLSLAELPHRVVVVIPKHSSTPIVYPRRPGIPAKHPL